MGLFTSAKYQARSESTTERSKWSVTLVLDLGNVFTSGFNSIVPSLDSKLTEPL